MRRKDREVTNIIEILQIIEKAKVLHLALFKCAFTRMTLILSTKHLSKIM